MIFQIDAVRLLALLAVFGGTIDTHAQSAPSPAEIAQYIGLHLAVVQKNAAETKRLLISGSDVNVRDRHGRTPLMVATYTGNTPIARLLIEFGADVNALDVQHYDMLTIAAVLNDIGLLSLALDSGADTDGVTSPYAGTALIAAAHLGHVEVVRALIRKSAPVDHVNNLGWTALIEAIVLGDGAANHQDIVRDLIAAGADPNLADGQGARPLTLARRYGYERIEQILLQAGAKP